jgi:diguanylate cyclase (GGDEF)-like protein
MTRASSTITASAAVDSRQTHGAGSPHKSAMLLVDRCGIVIEVFPGCELVSSVFDGPRRMSVSDLVIDQDHDVATTALRNVGDGFADRSTVRVRMLRPDGELRLVDLLVVDTHNHLHTDSLLVTLTDVTGSEATEALRNISRKIAIAGIDDTDQILDEVLQLTLEITGLSSVAVFVAEKTGEDLHIALSRTTADAPLPRPFQIGPLINRWKVVQRTLASDHPQVLRREDDTEAWDALNLSDLPPLDRVVFAPLVAGDSLEGIMSFGCRWSEWDLTPAASDFVMTAAELIAGSLSRRRSALALRERALRDSLTGLANRRLLVDRLEDALARTRRTGAWVSLLFIDCDGFKDVNDRFGHEVGDLLLVSIAERLSMVCRSGELVARFGGDEFVIMVESDLPEAAVVSLGERIVDNVSGAYEVGGRTVAITVSVGVSVHHGDDEPIDATGMFRRADFAMYRSKRLGKNRAELFTEEMEAHTKDRFELVSDMRSALRSHDQMVVWYQPIFDLRRQELTGYEALVRWNHPTRGLLYPGTFIELAEESGLIAELGWNVLELSLADLARWRSEGLVGQKCTVAVNLSVRQILNDHFQSTISALIEKSGVPPELIEFEVTETVFADRTTVVPKLVRLRELGTKLSIDDFGTGYSSLAYLRDLPVDILKIDRSFIEGLGTNPRDDALVGTLISLASQLDLETIAEGVEETRQLDTLTALGCERAQGYLLGRPQPELSTLDVFSQPQSDSTEDSRNRATFSAK